MKRYETEDGEDALELWDDGNWYWQTRGVPEFFGPFPSRAAAARDCERESSEFHRA